MSEATSRDVYPVKRVPAIAGFDDRETTVDRNIPPFGGAVAWVTDGHRYGVRYAESLAADLALYNPDRTFDGLVEWLGDTLTVFGPNVVGVIDANVPAGD